MRVTAGKLRSRIYKSPPGHRTYPMGEKVRSALFNILGDIVDLTVFDSHSGSGALVFEAISRGAANATAIDIDKKAYFTLKENIEKLGLEDVVHATRANSATWAKNNDDKEFDIVFCDPPYQDVNPLHIRAVSELVKRGGTFVLSHPKEYKTRLSMPMWQKLSEKSYANANLTIFRRK